MNWFDSSLNCKESIIYMHDAGVYFSMDAKPIKIICSLAGFRAKEKFQMKQR